MALVRYEAVGGIATITLDRPATLNSLDDELMTDLVAALRRVEDDDAIRVTILTGAGRGFCSGADLSEKPPAEPADEAELGSFITAMRILDTLPVPTIARIQGVAAGGGVGLALACDIAIAARSAWFVCTFGPRLGIVPDLGTTWHLPRSVGRARALGLSMLGPRITAEQAASWGLIWNVVDDERLDDEVATIAAQLARSSPEAMTRIRMSIDEAFANPLRRQIDLEMDHQAVLLPRNMAEGAAAFRERREPTFDARRYPSA